MKAAIRFLDLAAQYKRLRWEMSREIRETLKKGQFIGGSKVSKFENSFSQFLGVAHTVGVGNGTDALEISIEALDLPANSEILVPANSFIASAEAVTRSGHQVRFVDVNPRTYLIDFDKAGEVISSRSKAIIAVHLYGNAVNAEKLLRFASEHGLKVIEDCAQAHGALSGGIVAGSIGDIAAFSFYPGKNLGAYGDAGAISTQSDALAKRVRMIANHGRLEKYDHVFEGRNSRLDSLQAAVLAIKLRHLEGWTSQRVANATAYIKGLKGVGDIILPHLDRDSKHVFHLFVVQTARRDQLRAYLARAGIETGVHYPQSLPQLPPYRGKSATNPTPVADQLAGRILSLPVGEHLNERHISRVVRSIRGFFDNLEAAKLDFSH